MNSILDFLLRGVEDDYYYSWSTVMKFEMGEEEGILKLVLPGVKREDIKILVGEKDIVINWKGEGGVGKKVYSTKGLEGYYDFEKAESSYKDGILVIVAPRIKKERKEILISD